MTEPINIAHLRQRQAGILLHISSLPSAYGVGDLGLEALRFIDLLSKLGVKVWQILPINMPHADNSPYQCLSAHAGNPDFISLETLEFQGLLSKEDLAEPVVNKSKLLIKAYQAFHQQDKPPLHLQFSEFCTKEAHWLDDFALFLALRVQFNQLGWAYWPEVYKCRDEITMQMAKTELVEEIAAIKFTQFIFFNQWMALKSYAGSKGIQFFGDIPIFVAYDSADVWANSNLFKLDEAKNMTVVAGVPPDYFSATGQRWGNPHYNWEVMQSEDFSWWVSRMTTQNALFDMVRIDHFRGLEAAWEIPINEETAFNGHWVEAPGCSLLKAIKRSLPSITLIAEDLGIITEEVEALRESYHLPGMKILQFAFSGQEDNPYLPQNIEVDSVVYTGTHDNDTTIGWYQSLDDYHREQVHAYLRSVYSHDHQVNMPRDLIELAFGTKAYLAIIPMQDLLALDGHHRMNTPGTASGNWNWRFDWSQLTTEQEEFFAGVVERTGRKNNPSAI
ncbi:MAG: 4-alpha-glucanotransferase [Methylotenera sp.]|nr:4-alpha-glucanotransferase [Methylotenera sp.]